MDYGLIMVVTALLLAVCGFVVLARTVKGH